MKRFLFILSGLVLAFAVFASLEVTTTFQHVLAGVSYVCAALLLVGAAIVHSIDKVCAEIKKKG
jgi:hypothetical protein